MSTTSRPSSIQKPLPPSPVKPVLDGKSSNYNQILHTFDTLCWKIASSYDPLIAEQRIDLMISHTTALTDHVLEQLLKFKAEKFLEGVAWTSHQLCLLYRIQGDLKSSSNRKKVTQKIMAKSFPNAAFFSQITYHFHDLGILCLKTSTFAHAKKYFSRCLKRYQLMQGAIPKMCTGDIHYRLGKAAVMRGDNASVKRHFNVALQLFEGHHVMDQRVADMSFELGVAKHNSRSWKRADEYFCKAAANYERTHQWVALSKTYRYLALIRTKQKLHDEARKCEEKASHFFSLSAVQTSESSKTSSTSKPQPPSRPPPPKPPGPSNGVRTNPLSHSVPPQEPPRIYPDIKADMLRHSHQPVDPSAINSHNNNNGPAVPPSHNAWILAEEAPPYLHVHHQSASSSLSNSSDSSSVPLPPIPPPYEFVIANDIANGVVASAPPLSPNSLLFRQRSYERLYPSLGGSVTVEGSALESHGIIRRYTIHNDDGYTMEPGFNAITPSSSGHYGAGTLRRNSNLPQKLEEYSKLRAAETS